MSEKHSIVVLLSWGPTSVLIHPLRQRIPLDLFAAVPLGETGHKHNHCKLLSTGDAPPQLSV
jgi:hypothetical protein